MSDDTHRRIRALLASPEPAELHEGLALVKKEIARVGSEESKKLFEMVSTLFYIDPLDRPDLMPALDEAVSLVVGFGDWVIPVLIRQLEDSDVKAQLAVAHALGRIGADAIAPLLAEYQASTDAHVRQFVLYTLSKIKSPTIVRAAELACDAAQSEDRELRDTAMRAIGKLVEPIPPSALPAGVRRALIKALRTALADQNASIRAKAVRSLGKLARYGHLDPENWVEKAAPYDPPLEWSHMVCPPGFGPDDRAQQWTKLNDAARWLALNVNDVAFYWPVFDPANRTPGTPITSRPMREIYFGPVSGNALGAVRNRGGKHLAAKILRT